MNREKLKEIKERIDLKQETGFKQSVVDLFKDIIDAILEEKNDNNN